MTGNNPWNSNVRNTALATKHYNTACRHIESYQEQSSTRDTSSDMATWQKQKDRALASLIVSTTQN